MDKDIQARIASARLMAAPPDRDELDALVGRAHRDGQGSLTLAEVVRAKALAGQVQTYDWAFPPTGPQLGGEGGLPFGYTIVADLDEDSFSGEGVSLFTDDAEPRPILDDGSPVMPVATAR